MFSPPKEDARKCSIHQAGPGHDEDQQTCYHCPIY